MLDNETFNQILATVIVTALGFLWKWLSKKLKMKEIDVEFGQTLIAFTQREKDKFLGEIAEAKNPNSAGGVAVTPEELSKARENIWLRFKTDPNIREDVKAYAISRGGEFVKGLAGNLLDKIAGKR